MLGLWKKLSIVKKLYFIFGIMALLIAIELASLSFAIGTLSSYRAIVGGEGLWSKAQKDAMGSLQKYLFTKDFKYYLDFKHFLQVPLGGKVARVELEKAKFDYAIVESGLLKARIHSEDINGIVFLWRKFKDATFMKESLKLWAEGDLYVEELMKEGEAIKEAIQTNSMGLQNTLFFIKRIEEINQKLTRVEDEFSSTIANGSRLLEKSLWLALLVLVSTVELLGLILTFSFSRYLSVGLKKLTQAANHIGQGNFNKTVTISSEDELGMLAKSLNRMVTSLRENIMRREKAEHDNSSKDIFLANMSHEIRTPLSSILGYSELLKTKNISNEEKENFYDIIKKSGDNLNQIINDILDISKIKSGKVSLSKKSFSIYDLISDVEKTLKFKCEEKNVRLKINIDGNLPGFLFSDEDRIKQILFNILGNAIKFSANGEVSLNAYSQRNKIIMDVEDNGVGVPQQDQGKIFEIFTQGSDSRPFVHGGVGLGLPLSKHLAHLLDGDLTLIHSEVGKGSRFRLEFLCQLGKKNKAHEVISDKTNLEALNDKFSNNILVVDDSSDIRELLRCILVSKKFRVDLATNGQEGMMMALEKEYDIILMDVQMPVMDGFTAVRDLRKKGYLKPIIALTAHAMDEDRKKCLRAGFTDYLAKPLDMEKLHQKIIGQYY